MGNIQDLSAPQDDNKTAANKTFRLFTERRVLLLLTLLSILIRLPFFFRDYIDRDESTFILMGQAWVDGFLPYTFLWDVKPPLTFLFFASSIYLFGKSFLAIRLMGTLLVALTAYFTFCITLKLSNRKAALFSGIGCVILQSMFGSIQGVMSEHILMTFFMAALYLLLISLNKYRIALAGIALGIALMVKISIAFPILLLGIYLLIRYYKDEGLGVSLSRMFLLSFSAFVIILLTVLPYFLTGRAQLWWDSVVLAPLAYTEAGRTSALALIGLCLPILLFIFWGWRSRRLSLKKMETAVLVVSVLGLLFSFLKGGRINSHYLIQLYPPLLIIIMLVLAKDLNRIGKKAIPWICGILILLPVETYLEYVNIVKNKLQKGTFYNGEGFTVPAYLVENELDKEKTLFLGYHIGYWVMGKYPPTKTATHPSNICKSEMFPYYNPERVTAIEEVRFIMEEIGPKIIITRSNRSVFDRKQEEVNIYFDSILDSNYKLLDRVDNADIYSSLE
ncbi:MAG: glycosyltransferase family 39 protein [Flavobacteriaceae bacterium]